MLPNTAALYLDRVRQALPPDVRIYLVGGAIRDILLRRPTHDLDFVVQGNAKKIARQVAKSLDAPSYSLNDAFDAARILYSPVDETGLPAAPIKLDFASFRGNTLEDDLRGRDFTINAIAMDFSAAQRLIDPLHGAADIQKRIVRVCSPLSFETDPLRSLRAVRQANSLDFSIEAETRRLLIAALPQLKDVSAERIRDEFLRILSGKKPARAFRLLDTLGILALLFPELQHEKGISQSPPHVYPLWEHTLATLAKLEDTLAKFSPDFAPDKETGYSSNLAGGLAVMRLGVFRSQIHEYLQTITVGESSQKTLLFLAALYHDSGKPGTQSQDSSGRIHFFGHEGESARLVRERALALHMSNPETAWVQTIVQHHMRPLQLSLEAELPSRRAVYRFYRATGAAGISVCLLALADFLATYDYELPQEKWAHFLDVIRILMEGWWNQQDSVVKPPVLINGNDLMSLFQIPQGPQIGEFLARLEEAQAVGEIQTRDEALKFVEALLHP